MKRKSPLNEDEEDLVYLIVEEPSKFWHNFWNIFWICVVVLFIVYMFIPESAGENDYADYSISEDHESLIEDIFQFVLVSEEDIPISYSIEEDCNDFMGGRIRRAFIKISQETGSVLFFTEKELGADIEIACPLLVAPDEETYTAGEATQGVIGYSVKNATIDFHNLDFNKIWSMGACYEYPDTEIHEILHTFGFDHSYDIDGIMATSSQGCSIDSIDEYIVECLKYTYSYGEDGADCSYRDDVIGSIEDVEYDYEYEDCQDGWYDATNSEESCCPEPGMYIDYEGYCY